MRRTYPLLRLSPEAAGKLQHDHNRLTRQMAERDLFLAEFQRQVRTTLGAEALWSLQQATRQAIALTELKKECTA